MVPVVRRQLVLASASPRRKSLLEAAGFAVRVQPSGVDESWPGGGLRDGARALAERKCFAVAASAEVVVAADTLVVLGEARLEKPVDADDARRMLRLLAAKQHQVVTGYCVRRGAQHKSDAVFTAVTFRPLCDAEIEAYVASGEPFDKAGAYAIQGAGGALVDRVEGSYTNIVGLPLAEVIAAIEALV
jgi:septum formation protein